MVVRVHFMCSKGHSTGAAIHAVGLSRDLVERSAALVLEELRAFGRCTAKDRAGNACNDEIGSVISEEAPAPRAPTFRVVRRCEAGHTYESFEPGASAEEVLDRMTVRHGHNCAACGADHDIRVELH